MPHNEEPAAAGISQEQAQAQVGQQDAEVASRRVQQLGEAAPQASEPLEPERLNVLAEMLVGAVDALSQGQAQLPPPQEVTQPQEQIPADIFAPLMAIQGFLQAEGLKTDIDIESMATSNDGIGELAASISQLAGDAAVQMAANSPAKGSMPPEAPPAKETPEEAGVDRFLR